MVGARTDEGSAEEPSTVADQGASAGAPSTPGSPGTPGSPSTPGSGWKRTYWIVWVANLITSVGMMSFLPFLPGLLEEIGVEGEARVALWAGVIFGAAPLSAAVMGPVWGTLGDRFGRRVMVVRAMLSIALFVGAMAFVRTPVELLVLRLGQGLFSGFIPPSITLVSIRAPKDHQGRVAAGLQSALAVGAMVGPLIGGVFAARGNTQGVFLWIAGLATMASLLVWFGTEEDASQRQSAKGLSLGELSRGLAHDLALVWNAPRVKRATVLLFFLQFGLGATNPLMELYVRELHGSGSDGLAWKLLARFAPVAGETERSALLAHGTSVLFGGMALVNLIALPIWGRYGDRAGHQVGLVFCSLGVAASLFLQAAAPSYAWVFFGRMLMGAALAGAGPLAFGVAAAEIDVERRGGAFGVVFSSRLFAVSCGGAIGGALAGALGVRGLMVFAALFLLLVLGLQARTHQPVDDARPSSGGA